MTVAAYKVTVPTRSINAVPGASIRNGQLAFDLARDFKFSTAALASYAFARWEPVIYDALVVAACVEYADRTVARSTMGWSRALSLTVPVLEPDRWLAPDVYGALRDAACFLTGDDWAFDFVKRSGATPKPPQEHFQFNIQADAVIAFSDGMDSCAVAGLVSQSLGDKLVRVRVGSKAGGRPEPGERIPFAAVPYNVRAGGESTARSRGFKFALISGLAALPCQCARDRASGKRSGDLRTGARHVLCASLPRLSQPPVFHRAHGEIPCRAPAKARSFCVPSHVVHEGRNPQGLCSFGRGR